MHVFFYWARLLTVLLLMLGNILVWRKREHIRGWTVLLKVTLNLALVFFILRISQTEMPLPSLLVSSLGLALLQL